MKKNEINTIFFYIIRISLYIVNQLNF